MTEERATASDLDADLRDRAQSVARAIREEQELDERLDPYRPQMEADEERVPTLHLDDISGIPFVTDVSGVEEYQHRARIRAGDGDAVATSTEPAPGYEPYNREYLELGDPEHVVATDVDDPMAVARACRRGRPFERLVEWGRRSGRARIEPFMAIESVWRLARRLEEQGIDTTVRGPPPPVLWIANDKFQVADLIDRLFEKPRNPKSFAASTPEKMADRLLELADRYPRVALKRTRCASAMGNMVFESRELLEAGHGAVLEEVREFLARTNWPEGREVLLVRWLQANISPSTQCWIPPKGIGEVRVDGIYEQLLQGGTRVFAGSRPADLPAPLEEEMLETSLGTCLVLQKLGYVGRCSFDFVVAGNPAGDYELRMVDCNGRWGGTSLPMQLVDRLVEGERPPYRAQDFVDSGLIGAEFPEIVDACRDHLFRRDSQEGRFVFYNVGPLREYGKLDVISLGENQDEAAAGIDEVLPSLLGL